MDEYYFIKIPTELRISFPLDLWFSSGFWNYLWFWSAGWIYECKR